MRATLGGVHINDASMQRLPFRRLYCARFRQRANGGRRSRRSRTFALGPAVAICWSTRRAVADGYRNASHCMASGSPDGGTLSLNGMLGWRAASGRLPGRCRRAVAVPTHDRQRRCLARRHRRRAAAHLCAGRHVRRTAEFPIPHRGRPDTPLMPPLGRADRAALYLFSR